MRISDWSSDVCSSDLLIEDPEWATPEKRLPKLDQCFAIIEEWTMTRNKFEVMELLNEHNIPCGPVMDMKELMNDESLRARGTIVEVPHPQRGSFQTVGCPIKLSGSPVEVKTSTGLGEHTEGVRSDKHTPELHAQLRNTYDVFCLKT